MLARRLRRHTNIDPALSKCVVFAVILPCQTNSSNYPANTGHSPKAVSMLAHRLRRWPNIETALGECPVYAGYTYFSSKSSNWCLSCKINPMFYHFIIRLPSKHETLNQCNCWVDVRPTSKTVGQHQPSIGSMSRVCRVHAYHPYCPASGPNGSRYTLGIIDIINRLLGNERVYLTQYKVVDTIFHILGDKIILNYLRYERLYLLFNIVADTSFLFLKRWFIMWLIPHIGCTSSH